MQLAPGAPPAGAVFRFSRAFDAQFMGEKSFQLPLFSGCHDHTLA
jgi:hypothetical protein